MSLHTLTLTDSIYLVKCDFPCCHLVKKQSRCPNWTALLVPRECFSPCVMSNVSVTVISQFCLRPTAFFLSLVSDSVLTAHLDLWHNHFGSCISFSPKSLVLIPANVTAGIMTSRVSNVSTLAVLSVTTLHFVSLMAQNALFIALLQKHFLRLQIGFIISNYLTPVFRNKSRKKKSQDQKLVSKFTLVLITCLCQ